MSLARSPHAENRADYTGVSARGSTSSEQRKEKAKKAKEEVEKGTTSVHVDPLPCPIWIALPERTPSLIGSPGRPLEPIDPHRRS
jgi:hypothetical protein